MVSTKEPKVEGVVRRKELKNYFQEDKRKEKTVAYHRQEKAVKNENAIISLW